MPVEPPLEGAPIFLEALEDYIHGLPLLVDIPHERLIVMAALGHYRIAEIAGGEDTGAYEKKASAENREDTKTFVNGRHVSYQALVNVAEQDP